jgi:hypothetical protein
MIEISVPAHGKQPQCIDQTPTHAVFRGASRVPVHKAHMRIAIVMQLIVGLKIFLLVKALL